jgi:multidrug efflux system outer membrane protein
VPLLDTSLRQAIYRLGVLIGKSPGELLPEFEEAAPIPALPPGLPDVLPSELLRRRPDIRRAERELAGATARIGVATADLFPRFSLNGSFSVQSADISKLLDRDSQAWSVGPSMRWRIFDAGAILSNIKVQDARAEQALYRYRRAVLTSLEEVENAQVAYFNDTARSRILSAAVEANRQALELAQDGYRRGLVLFDFLRLIEAQRSLFVAEEQLIESQQAVVGDLISLYKALGGGWEPSCPEQDPPASRPSN